MLPQVSRTYAITIALLPPRLAHAVSMAYLLCGVADTIEDCELMDAPTKQRLLAIYANAVQEERDEIPELAEAFAGPRMPDEELARDVHHVMASYKAMEKPQRDAILPWLLEMCKGMAGFATRHDKARPGHVEALDTVDDLDSYCYYVAGTVGHILTELYRADHHRVTERHYARMKPLSTSFGVGLQMTNIMKDVADDRQRGWMYVPREFCAAAGTTPEQFLDPDMAPQAKQVMDMMMRKAGRHLRDGLDFCLTLPRSQYRMRVSSMSPLFFAVRTLAVAAQDPKLLDPSHKVKISRKEVKKIVRDIYLVAPNNNLVRNYFRRLAAGAPVPHR